MDSSGTRWNRKSATEFTKPPEGIGVSRLCIFYFGFGFVSDFEFRISDFTRAARINAATALQAQPNQSPWR
jgi:hypothetical protein